MSFIYFDQQAAFDDLCMQLLEEPAIAVDTEFVRRKTYYPILALMQIATAEQIYLIDPLKIGDWSKLVALFQSPTRVVMHSCSEDLEVFRNAFDQLPVKLLDTQVAAAYLGKGDSLGYAALVALMCGEEIDKSETQSDWSQRPLTDAQLRYAAEDVRWLLGIESRLRAELEEQNRMSWVDQEMQSLKDRYETEPAADQAWLRLKAVGRLSERDWPLAQALCAWREETARSRDKPKTWIVKDPELLEIIQQRPKTGTELARLPSVSPVTIRHHGEKILAQVRNTEQLSPPEQVPQPELTGSERKLLKQMQQLVSEFAEKEGLAQRFVANKHELSQYILYQRERSDQSSVLNQGWRKEMLGKQLEALL